MKYIDYNGRWLKLKNGEYTKIIVYDTNGYAETDNGMIWDLHYSRNQTDFKKYSGEELMSENYFKDYNYELY